MDLTKYKEVDIDEVDFYLFDLKSKFRKINPSEYYLSYSGGKDSHLLYWFLRIYLKEHDPKMYEEYKQIPIVGSNTFMEHFEILDRIRKNCDVVVFPKLKPLEIKAKYGTPCFSKAQDEKIRRYQNGLRSEALMKFITREDPTSMYNLNKKASELLLSGKLHKVSPYCCKYLKKEPMAEYNKKTGRHPILGITSDEGLMRKTQYTTCFTKDKKFVPMHDLPKELEEQIYKKYNIDIPEIYEYVDRTGCMGCPYGSYKGKTQKELLLVSPAQYKFYGLISKKVTKFWELNN